MGDEWKVYPLRRLVIVHREQVNPLDYPQQDFLHFSIPAYDDGQRPVTQKGYEIKSSKFLVPPDSVLLSRINPRFPRVWLPNIDASVPAVASTEFLVCTPKDGIDRRFLFYACLSPQFYKELRGRVTGTSSSHQRVRPEDALSIPVPVPPLPEQHAIAHILGTLDDKIELDRRMNETLEAMARALFKSWFVDFDPVVVNAIKAGNPIPEKFAKRAAHYRQNPDALHLPEHILHLFPDRFADSELGPIPEGWEVKMLGDLSSLNPESWTKGTRPFKITYVDLSNTKWGRIDAVTTYTACNAPSRAQRVLRPGDTIVGTVRPGNGSYALISEPGLTGSTGFAVLRPNNPAYVEFVYLAATSPDNIERLALLADGAAYPAVRPDEVAATPIVPPDNKVFNRFSRAVGPILGKIAQNERESRMLAALRDALLPKLISGEVRVRDAEQILKEERL